MEPTNASLRFILEHYRNGYRQKHECTCGPSSLALAAASIGLPFEPEDSWLKEAYSRWFPVTDFLRRGMALHEAQLVTELVFQGAAEVLLRRAYPENFDLFRQDVEGLATIGDGAIALNFAQDHLTGAAIENQGNPHYSPVAGFDPKTGLIVIADVDAEILEPYSVKIDKAFESMGFVNPAFNLPRGWLVIRRRKNQNW